VCLFLYFLDLKTLLFLNYTKICKTSSLNHKTSCNIHDTPLFTMSLIRILSITFVSIIALIFIVAVVFHTIILSCTVCCCFCLVTMPLKSQHYGEVDHYVLWVLSNAFSCDILVTNLSAHCTFVCNGGSLWTAVLMNVIFLLRVILLSLSLYCGLRVFDHLWLYVVSNSN